PPTPPSVDGPAHPPCPPPFPTRRSSDLATILLTAGDFSSFATPGHLAAYAGIAPVTRRSGTSIRGEFPARSGNKQLKNALFRSADRKSTRLNSSHVSSSYAVFSLNKKAT